MADAAAAEHPRRVLEEVLARAEFQRPGAESSSWLQDLVDRLAGAVGGVPDWAGAVVTFGVVVAAVLLVASILRERPGTRGRAAAAPADPGADSPAPPAADVLYGTARDAQAAGRCADAVVLYFRAMVARLVERGLLLADPSRTNREHARDLQARPAECALLLEALPGFEAVRYGRAPADAEDARRAAATAARLFPERAA